MTGNSGMADDLYGRLGVKPAAGPDTIRRAFRRLAKSHHPDVGGVVDEFLLIKHAYEVLMDPAERFRYDMEREEMLAKPAVGKRARANEDGEHLYEPSLSFLRQRARSLSGSLALWGRLVWTVLAAATPALWWSYSVSVSALRSVPLSPVAAMLHPWDAWSLMWANAAVGGVVAVLSGTLVAASVLSGISIAAQGKFRWPIRVVAYWVVGSFVGDIVGAFGWQSVIVVPVVTVMLFAATGVVWKAAGQFRSYRLNR